MSMATHVFSVRSLGLPWPTHIRSSEAQPLRALTRTLYTRKAGPGPLSRKPAELKALALTSLCPLQADTDLAEQQPRRKRGPKQRATLEVIASATRSALFRHTGLGKLSALDLLYTNRDRKTHWSRLLLGVFRGMPVCVFVRICGVSNWFSSSWEPP